MGGKSRASKVAKLEHPVREPARTVDIVPALVEQSLLSGNKFAEADYISIYDKDEVNIYDALTTKITVSKKAVLKGWRCPITRLWRIPLKATIESLNSDTLLLDSKNGQQSLNPLYIVPTTKEVCNHLSSLLDTNRPPTREAINNVYELPSIKPTIRYLHGAAGFPTKSTWLNAIRKGNFLTWPLVNVKNVNKYFPESEETQKGHMRGQRQGVRSTKKRTEAQAIQQCDQGGGYDSSNEN